MGAGIRRLEDTCSGAGGEFYRSNLSVTDLGSDDSVGSSLTAVTAESASSVAVIVASR